MRKRNDSQHLHIIDSATSLFSKKGYTATTIDTVAKSAGTTKKTVNQYYDDKQSLLLAVIENSVGTPWEFNTPVEQVRTPEGFYKALYIIAKGINQVFAQPEYVGLVRAMIAAVDSQPELRTIVDAGITKRAVTELVKLFESASKNNVIIVHNPELSANRFVGGFLTNIYFDGLLAPATSKVYKYTPKELFDYVSSYMPRLVGMIVNKDGAMSSGG